jgi:hypothetical protein
MIVVDLVGDAHGQRRGARVAAIGSCRVTDPLEKLVEVGRAVRLWANVSYTPHTLREAQQAIRFARGEVDIPARFRPFIFHPPEQAEAHPDDRRLLETVDAFLVEACDRFHLRHGSHYFQVNHFIIGFVSKYGAALLPWYRALSLGRPITDAIVASALEELADRSAGERAFIETVLRHTRLEPIDVAGATAALGDVVFDRRKKWVVVSHFAVPGMSGTQMKDRRALAEILRQAATRHGVTMFDPSVMLERLGRASVLASGGRDIHHYDPDFIEGVGD